MSQINQWSKSATLVVFALTLAEALFATASVALTTESTELVARWVNGTQNVENNADRTLVTDEPDSFRSTPFTQTRSFFLAQGLNGQCRAAARPTFIYTDRSMTNPIRALQTNEEVTLAEGSGREGWIAIGSPIIGFVQTKDLKPCAGDSGVTTPSTPSNSSPNPSPNRCRRVIYEGDEGLVIRESPNTASARVGSVFLTDRVTLSEPPQFRLDDAGREWVRISAPMTGWISNGFPELGDINLKACF